MAVEERDATSIKPPPSLEPSTPSLRRWRRREILQGAAVFTGVATVVGTAAVYKHQEQNEQDRINDAVAAYDEIRPILAATFNTIFRPAELKNGILLPVPPEAQAVPRTDMWNNLLRGIKRMRPDWLPFDPQVDSLPPPQSQKIYLAAQGILETETTDDHSALLFSRDWLPHLNIPISAIFYGELQGDITNLSQASRVEILLQTLAQAEGTIRDPFSRARLALAEQIANRTTQQYLTQADGRMIDQTLVDPNLLANTIVGLLKVPNRTPTPEAKWSQGLLPAPNRSNYYSPGVAVEFNSEDGKLVKAVINSLGDLMIQKKLA
jgi:hypothetical protein